MKHLLLCLCLLLACASVAAAGGDGKKEGKPHPDLSGTWELDRSKSDFGLFSDRPVSKADSTLVIAHRDPELKITRTMKLNGQQEVREFAYYTDERGETNPAAIGAGEVKSKTKWEGEKVAAHSKMSWPGRGGAAAVEMDVTQKWQVSSDGKTLTNTTVITNQMGANEIKLVYRRAP
ncbi:MAG TPA: hypothetical protein VNZ44_05140 [Pyrinomonadaceae bacterium]|nr:hypothetical protein [Pyrinomonadaceae bacterium]